MAKPVARAFRPSDAIVLAVASAVGVGWMVVESSRDWPTLFQAPRGGWEVSDVVKRLATAFASATPLAWSWTAAVFALGWLGSGRAGRRLMRRPGLAACAAATMGFGADYFLVRSMLAGYLRASMGGAWFARRWPKVFTLESGHYVDLHVAGYAVLAVWLVLAMGGRWRAERSWVDRAGRVLGFWWVAMIPCQELVGIL